MPVAVRGSLEREWFVGWTVNVSRSGVLIELFDGAPVSSAVEFVLALCGQDSTPGVTNLNCHGRVVRVEQRDGNMVTIAVTIDGYEHLPR